MVVIYTPTTGSTDYTFSTKTIYYGENYNPSSTSITTNNVFTITNPNTYIKIPNSNCGALGGGGKGGINFGAGQNGFHGIYINSINNTIKNYGILAGGGGGGSSGVGYSTLGRVDIAIAGGLGGAGGGGGGGAGAVNSFLVGARGGGPTTGTNEYPFPGNSGGYITDSGATIGSGGGGGCFCANGGSAGGTANGGTGSSVGNLIIINGGIGANASPNQSVSGGNSSAGGGGGGSYGGGGGGGGAGGGAGGNLTVVQSNISGTTRGYGTGGGGGGSGGGIGKGSNGSIGGNGGYGIFNNSGNIFSLYNLQGNSSGWGPLFYGGIGGSINYYYITITSDSIYGQFFNTGVYSVSNLTFNFDIDPDSSTKTTGNFNLNNNIINATPSNSSIINQSKLLNNGYTIVWSLNKYNTPPTLNGISYSNSYYLTFTVTSPSPTGPVGYLTSYTGYSANTDLSSIFLPLINTATVPVGLYTTFSGSTDPTDLSQVFEPRTSTATNPVGYYTTFSGTTGPTDLSQIFESF